MNRLSHRVAVQKTTRASLFFCQTVLESHELALLAPRYTNIKRRPLPDTKNAGKCLKSYKFFNARDRFDTSWTQRRCGNIEGPPESTLQTCSAEARSVLVPRPTARRCPTRDAGACRLDHSHKSTCGSNLMQVVAPTHFQRCNRSRSTKQSCPRVASRLESASCRLRVVHMDHPMSSGWY